MVLSHLKFGPCDSKGSLVFDMQFNLLNVHNIKKAEIQNLYHVPLALPVATTSKTKAATQVKCSFKGHQKGCCSVWAKHLSSLVLWPDFYNVPKCLTNNFLTCFLDIWLSCRLEFPGVTYWCQFSAEKSRACMTYPNFVLQNKSTSVSVKVLGSNFHHAVINICSFFFPLFLLAMPAR